MAKFENYVPKAAGDIVELNLPLSTESPSRSKSSILGKSKGKWIFQSIKTHISKRDRVDEVSALLGIPAPEMLFAENALVIRFEFGSFEKESKSEIQEVSEYFELRFDALEALKCVSKHGESDNNIKVEYADKWQKYRDNKSHQVVNNYDWTYTSNYKGTTTCSCMRKINNYDNNSNNCEHYKIITNVQDEKLNMEKLMEREPILFFDEVSLYEDELGDNGTCTFDVKMRVMPSGFFILLQMFLRVDGVLVKTHCTRIHHLFNSNYLLREFQIKYNSVAELKKFLPRQALTIENTNEFLNMSDFNVEKIYLNK